MSLVFMLGQPQANCKAISTSMPTHRLKPSSVFGSRRIDEPFICRDIVVERHFLVFSRHVRRLVFASVLVGSDASSSLVIASPRRQRMNNDRSQEPRFFWATHDLLREEMNLQDCNIPSRRTPETSWAMISRIPPRYCLCCVFGRRFVGSAPSNSSPDGFRNLCVTWRGKSVVQML